jgi:hypothetical protein
VALAEGEGDAKLLEAITSAYERAMLQWGPWAKFRKVLSPLGLDERSIAYTNVAKCWQTLKDTPDCRKPMKACASEFPIDRLAGDIEACAIVIMSAPSTLAYAGVVEGRVPLYSFPGRPSDAELRAISSALHERFIGGPDGVT